MISELSNANYKLTKEKKVQVVIRSPLSSWDYMKLHLTHASNIQTFNDVVHYLELEKDCLSALKINGEAHVAYSGPQKGLTSNEKKKQRSFFFRNQEKDLKEKQKSK